MYLCCLWKSQQTNGVQESNVAGKWIFHRVGTAQRCAKMQNLGGGIPPVASRLNCPFMGSFFWADLGGNRGLDSNLWGWHRLKFTATSPAWWPRRRRRPAFGKGVGGGWWHYILSFRWYSVMCRNGQSCHRWWRPGIFVKWHGYVAICVTH